MGSVALCTLHPETEASLLLLVRGALLEISVEQSAHWTQQAGTKLIPALGANKQVT